LRSYGVLNLDEWYGKEITEASYNELITLTTWINKSYINSKIWKDEYDITKLSESAIDKEKISQIVETTNFTEYFQRELKRLKINIT
jgi:hypothetical protein